MPCTAWGGARMTWATLLYSLSSLPLNRRAWSEAILHSGDVLGLSVRALRLLPCTWHGQRQSRASDRQPLPAASELSLPVCRVPLTDAPTMEQPATPHAPSPRQLDHKQVDKEEYAQRDGQTYQPRPPGQRRAFGIRGQRSALPHHAR